MRRLCRRNRCNATTIPIAPPHHRHQQTSHPRNTQPYTYNNNKLKIIITTLQICAGCAGGTVAPSHGSSACAPCPPATYSPALPGGGGGGACTSCPPDAAAAAGVLIFNNNSL